MMGNDYLPKLKYIKYESVWKSYFETVKKTKSNIIYKGNFNLQVLKIFGSNLVKNISKTFRKFNKKKYDEDCVKNYLEGLLWCLNMYRTGCCSMYDYVFRYKSAPSPPDIYYFLCNYNNKIRIPCSDTPPIKKEVFTLLVMPIKAKKLISKKYQKYMDKELKYIYESEQCKKCKIYKKKLGRLHKKLKNKNKDDVAEFKDIISSINIKFNNHKKNHTEFTVEDINKIIAMT
jgi:5'-3' exonuclease